MATWRTYATGVFVTGGILIGTLTYRYVTGQAMAELAGASWERSVVARTYGTNPPAFWYDAVVTTNRVTNYTATVTLEYASGVQNVDFSTTSLEFSSTNWSVAQLVSVTRKDPWTPGSGTYDVKYNGVTETQVFYSAQSPGAGPGFAFGAAVGPNVSWTPLTTGVGDDEPALSTVVLTHSPTNGTMTVSTSMVVTAISGMAAITPFVRNDQMRFFMDQLRNSLQEGGEAGSLWWLDGTNFGEAVVADGLASYVTPQFYATTNRWAGSGYDDVLAEHLYPTGGLIWARDTGGSVTATPSFYTLNTMAFLTNGTPKLNYYPGLFGWSGSTTDRLGRVMHVPSAAFPYGETSHEAFDYVDVSGYGRANGSWWFDAGMHSNAVWQVQGNEYVVSGAVKRISWIATNDFIKCGVMSGAMSSTLALTPMQHDSNTITTVTFLDGNTVSNSVTVSTNALPDGDLSSYNVVAAASYASDYIHNIEYVGGVTSYLWTYDGGGSWINAGTATPADSYYTNSSSSAYMDASSVAGAYTAYPSAYAITNGYVSRVRVYMIYTASRGVVWPYATTLASIHPENWVNSDGVAYVIGDEFCDTTGVTPTDGTWANASAVSVNNSGDWYVTDDESDFFSLGITLQDYNDPPDLDLDVPVRTVGRTLIGSSYGPFGNGLAKVRVTLVADVANPTEYPIRFSFGPLAPALVTAFDYSGEVLDETEDDINGQWEFPYTDDPGCDYTGAVTMTDMITSHTYVYRRRSTERHLTCGKNVIVVVDWNFKHMNPANPYVPDPFVPAWLTPAP